MRSRQRATGVATALTLGVLISMTACGSGSDDVQKLEPRLQRMVPTDKPSLLVTALSGQPAETREVTGKYFSMYVPANFQEKSSPMASGEQIVAFDSPSSEPASPVRVAVVPDPKAGATAIEQSYAVELQKQSEQVKDFTRSTVKWPGAVNAILLQWTESRAGASSGDAPLRTLQLMAQVNDQLIVSVIAVAPSAEFDTAGLVKIVQTFRPKA